MTTHPDGFVLHRRAAEVVGTAAEMAAGDDARLGLRRDARLRDALLDRASEARITGQDSGRGTFFHRPPRGGPHQTGAPTCRSDT